MIDLVELRARIAEKAAKGIHAAPVLFDIIEELEHARGERPAVVAHLRERAVHGAGNVMSVEDACTTLADLFERGEHRREEER